MYILHRQHQFNKVDRMLISTTYFRQITVFFLDLEWVFAKSYVKLVFLGHNSVSHNITITVVCVCVCVHRHQVKWTRLTHTVQL